MSQNLVKAFEELASSLQPEGVTDSAEAERLEETPETDRELLAIDIVESVNNTLKRIAEAAVATKMKTGAAVEGVGAVLAVAGKDYVGGLEKGFKRAAKKQGPIDGERAFKWLRRAIVTGAAGSGSVIGLSHLIAKYPQIFGWLENVIKLLF